MANVCCTEIVFDGDVKAIKRLRDAMKDANTTPGGIWYKIVADELGLTIPEDIGYRGSVESYEDDDIEAGILRVSAEDAWCPQEAFLHFISKELGIRYCYRAEEFGADIACIHNDPDGRYFTTRFVLDVFEDVWDLCPDYYEFGTEKELVEFLNSHSGETREFAEWVSELSDMDELSFHQYDFDCDDLAVNYKEVAA